MVTHDFASEDLIFDKLPYFGKVFGRTPDVELDAAI